MTAPFDFGAFPPEINSAKMYAGPGSGSMLSAAATWNGLASELRSQAANYSSIVSNLTGDRLAGAGINGDGGRGSAVHVVDEHDGRCGRADRRPGASRGGRVRGGVRNDRAAAGDRRQPNPVGVVGRNECAWPERAGDRRHRGPLRPDVGAGRRGDVRVCRTIGDGDQGAVVRQRAADHDGRSARRAGSRDHSGRRLQHASGVGAVDLCRAGHVAGDGYTGCIHVVDINALRARGTVERWLIGKLSARQLLERVGTERQHLEHVDLDRRHQPVAGGADGDRRQLPWAQRDGDKRRPGRTFTAGHGGRPGLGHNGNFRYWPDSV